MEEGKWEWRVWSDTKHPVQAALGCNLYCHTLNLVTVCLWDTVGAQWDTCMTLPMCARVHIPSVHPAEKFNHSTQGDKFVFTDGCLMNGSTGYACMIVERACSYQLHPYNSVFTVEVVIPCNASKKVVMLPWISCYESSGNEADDDAVRGASWRSCLTFDFQARHPSCVQ
jgi:hypothetical protein